jgi:ATP-dependent DNA helicase RecG
MNLTDLKGIGPSTLKKLENLGITDIPSLLHHFPSRYIDRRKKLKLADILLIDDENYHAEATIDSIKTIRLRGGRMIVNAVLNDDTGSFNVTWFNNPYISSNYQNGDHVVVSGKPDGKKIINPKMKKVVNDDDIENFGKVEAIYPETRGLRSYQLSRFIHEALDKFIDSIKESLPKKVLKSEKLLNIKEALTWIHFPTENIQIEQARERLGFEEIYNLLKQVQKRKASIKHHKSNEIQLDEKLYSATEKTLPYQLTGSQRIAVEEIYKDLEGHEPMHRLLNGDVGSGKTIVAFLAALQVLKNNMQVLFLAPTSVLASQHYKTLTKLLGDSNIKVHLVTSNTKKEIEKLEQEINDDIKNELFIGTHALLHHFNIYKNIGLVIIDEQHKFGVNQRELLEDLSYIDSSGEKFLPHVLSMSATPIPRTLALTIFGDIDVSIIYKPEERKKIITKCIHNTETQEKMYEWLRQNIKTKKEQVYIVCPLIAESATLDTKSVMKEYENLKEVYPEFKIEILHGKIKPALKDEILERFKDGEIDILISTSVIEVGIDNPNATVMIIEGAERFGLAQLHQIRGRVGRSDKQSYCFLKTTENIEIERLNYFADNQDGFKVAEFDLANRGPGEVYGEKQSGIPDLKIANILDIEFIKRVKKWFG